MKRVVQYGLALVISVVIASPSVASADSTNHVVISELQTGTAASASQEFVELYNASSTEVSVAGWTVEYKPAASADVTASWTKKATLVGQMKAYGFFLIAPKSYLASADSDWSATLAGSGGAVRVRDAQGNVIDQIGYGAGTVGAEGVSATAAPNGQSLERLPGRLNEAGGNGVDTGSNLADFIVRTAPQPQSTSSTIELPDSDTQDPVSIVPVQAPVSGPVASDGSPAPQAYAPIDITELMPNPMAPLADSHDEYIELYNPTSDPVNLQGYSVRTGSNFHSYYVLPSTVLEPGSYLALYSAQTHLSLPNSGGAAEILDPTGTVADITPSYGAATEGLAWARFDDGWHWTIQTTPGHPNVLETALVPAALAKSKKVTHPSGSKAAVKAVKKAKRTATKQLHPRTKKPKAKLGSKIKVAAQHSLQPAGWLIITIVILTIGYALYEFRYDIYNLYRHACGDAKAGSEDRQAAERRRSD